MTKTLRIAIDGPAAAGKSTVAKKLAEQLSIVYVDTGAMYRALTLKALQQPIALNDSAAVFSLLKKTTIQLIQDDEEQQVYIDSENVTHFIRTDEVSNNVSEIAQHASVREEMVKRQQEIAKNKNVVMDGRDIGTHVLPNAEVKIFLLASVEERAERRFLENKQKGYAADIDILKKEIKERDEKDMNRKTSPLVQAEDAHTVDTTSLTIDEVVATILTYVNKQ